MIGLGLLHTIYPNSTAAAAAADDDDDEMIMMTMTMMTMTTMNEMMRDGAESSINILPMYSHYSIPLP